MSHPDFAHLHVHSEYSLLDGANRIGSLVDACVKDGQKALALTDHARAALPKLAAGIAQLQEASSSSKWCASRKPPRSARPS